MTKITRFAIVAALIALPAAAQAQVGTQITGSISASADISTVFAFGTVADLKFGTITPGNAATATGSIAISRNVGVTYTLPDAANTGKMTSSGGATLMPSYTCGIGSTNSAVVTAFSSCTPASGTASVGSSAAPTAKVDEFVVFVGALTATQTNTAPGSYTGVIRITATQN